MPNNNIPNNAITNNAITQNMIDESYKIAVQVFNNVISKQTGIDSLAKNTGMNKGSASDYIDNYKCLRNGTGYKRTMNENATRTYLQNIYNDLGVQGLQLALQAVQQHLDYYESLEHGQLSNIRALYNYFAQYL